MVTTATHEDIALIRLRGAIDEDSAPGLAQALAEAAASGRSRTVVDLSDADFADSHALHALHALLDAQNLHQAAGVSLVLAGPLQIGVRRLFEVTGTAAAFRITDSLESAMTC
ncbi:STAS domain-containing protein [Streptomyces sp. NBC_01264]|uniref:STAS domain-containing protein n=1 Tax=Streptomyces sp. NBC_01264 TaxID=2903804 RepID=UPI00224D1B70|nr:STAS domain-containing protein [Streptomyces sp. NBC_01264]MCX4775418.1 STAS domain-containing protein [Streptomyces sp. NBC_01264]